MGERAVVPLLCIAAGVAIAVATWLLLVREPEPAGFASLAAGAALVAGGVLLRPDDRLGRVALSFGDRLFDGCVLGALTWVSRTEDPWLAAGALFALAAGFLASYIRARGGLPRVRDRGGRDHAGAPVRPDLGRSDRRMAVDAVGRGGPDAARVRRPGEPGREGGAPVSPRPDPA